MIRVTRWLLAGFSLMGLTIIADRAVAAQSVVTPKAQFLLRQIENMHVESRWLAGAHVDWESGEADGVAETLAGRHTHCSAFVAAAAEKLGVYILRPPEHGQVLLANAQNEWLATEGRAQGWRHVASATDAQDAANRGLLVVASYHNHRDSKPGHIAIVRPGDKAADALAVEGPDVIQAATVNSVSIDERTAFAGHPAAWDDNEIEYYAHSVKVTVGAK
jgi:hypothetical protein